LLRKFRDDGVKPKAGVRFDEPDPVLLGNLHPRIYLFTLVIPEFTYLVPSSRNLRSKYPGSLQSRSYKSIAKLSASD
jgi:hypothetical protein